MIIAPSVLSVAPEKRLETIKMLVQKGIKYLHLDVMDGKFVPNQTFDFNFIKELRPYFDINFDVHLMIEDPITQVLSYVEAGTDILTFHYEATTNPLAVINEVKRQNIRVGCSIKPRTAVEEIRDLLPFLDLVLVMSVEPGFGGQRFIDDSLGKISLLKEIKEIEKYQYIIEVDGGINLETAFLVKNAGADMIVVGSYLMNSDDFDQTLNNLKKLS